MQTLISRLPACAVPALLLLSGCNRPWQYNDGEYPYTTLDPSTDFGEAIMGVYSTITWVTIVIFIIVTAIMAVTLVRFRDDGGAPPEQIHGNTQMEIGWTLAPVVIVVLLMVPTVRTIFEIADAAPDGSLEVRVIGKRWWWAFEYVESGVVTANELHLPANRPVSLLIESDTVIHSFWTPRLGGKRDAVPGRINRMWFTITDDIQKGAPETYLGECAEYCGEAHSRMLYQVVGHEASEFDQWLADYTKPVAVSGLAAKGEAHFNNNCASCHSLSGNDQAKGVQGPNLTKIGARKMIASGIHENNTDNLKQWLRDPDVLKPGTTKKNNPSRALDGMNIPKELSEEEIEAIVAYLQAQK